jgi:hypothetical protein
MPVNEPPEEMVNEPPAEALDALVGEVPWEDGRGEPGAS